MVRCVALTLALAAVGSAQAEDRSGLLLGIGGGRSTYDVPAIDFSDHATAWKALVGWRFNSALTAEVAYIDGGSVSAQFGTVSATIEGQIVQASLTGGWWITDALGAYARAGANYYDAELHASGPGGSVAVQDHGTEFGWGAGLQALWDRALWRLEYESVEFEDVDGELLSLSIVWQF